MEGGDALIVENMLDNGIQTWAPTYDLTKVIRFPESGIGLDTHADGIRSQTWNSPTDYSCSLTTENNTTHTTQISDHKNNGAWFAVNVLTLKDGKAFVYYTEIQSDQ
ncbi:hypothetical protein Tco_0023225, partial [Tanacetum coccineum]